MFTSLSANVGFNPLLAGMLARGRSGKSLPVAEARLVAGANLWSQGTCRTLCGMAKSRWEWLSQRSPFRDFDFYSQDELPLTQMIGYACLCSPLVQLAHPTEERLVMPLRATVDEHKPLHDSIS